MNPLPTPFLFVTGATGFLGSAFVRRAVAEGARVHAFVRPSSERGGLKALPVRWHEGDLTCGEDVGRAIAVAASEANAAGQPLDVVHLAGLVSYRTADTEALRRTNVEGTRWVLEACVAAGVRRLVHVSSVVAVGPAPGPRHALDEEAPFDGARLRSAYVTTKRAAEELVRAVAPPPEAVVVCPGAVFGPSPKGSNTSRMLARWAQGRSLRWAPPGSLGVVGVEDVAEGILLALTAGRPGRRYLLVERNLECAELMELVGRRYGHPAPRRVLPAAWRAFVAASAALDRLVPLQVATPQALRLLGTHFRFDTRRAREELGWRPTPFPEVLERTLEWVEAGLGRPGAAGAGA